MPVMEWDPHVSQYDHCQEPSWWSDDGEPVAYVKGTVLLTVRIPVGRFEAEHAERREDGARTLLLDKVGTMGTLGDLDDVLDTYDAADAEIIWEGE